MTISTIFSNPEGLLVPGMYARVEISGLSIPNAMLVPERALQQLLGKTLVIVARSDNIKYFGVHAGIRLTRSNVP